MASFGHTQRKCDVTITSVLRRNDAATSFWCDDVISTSYVCWAISQPFTYWIVLRNRKQFCVDSTLHGIVQISPQWRRQESTHQFYMVDTITADGMAKFRLNKRLSKQSRRQWFETPSHSLWRYFNEGVLASIMLAQFHGMLRSQHQLG